MPQILPPRLVVAASASGRGKTTVAIGLMAALRARGLRVVVVFRLVFRRGRPGMVSPSFPGTVSGGTDGTSDGIAE